MTKARTTARPPIPRPSRRRGFTLVEVMMASVILTIGFGAMIQAMIIGSEILANARRQTLATQILTQEIEKLQFNDWPTINALSSGPTAVAIDPQFNDAITASGATFLLNRSTANVDTELKEITFTVTWTVRSSGQQAARTYTRINSAYFAKYGLNLTYQRS